MKCPHGCSNKSFAWSDCITDPGAVPSEGDCGVCHTCGGWWELKQGIPVKYTPSREEMALAIPQMTASRRRFKERFR